MKFIHLSDLHLGKLLQGHSLLEDQKYMLNNIINIIQQENIEAVLISGDIYDKSIPPIEAVNLLDEFLNAIIKKLKCKVFVIAGNHDSKDRLGFGNRIFENDGLYIESKYEGKLRKIKLEDEFGRINIYLLPFIKPIEVKKYFDMVDTYENAISEIIKNENINKMERNIILVHQFVTSAGVEPERSESEIISVGGVENVDVKNFDNFDYVAIGHVHRPQQIGRSTARYSGTILKYSFSEINHKKTIPIVNMKEKNNIDIKLHELIPLREMREIKGPIEELIKRENYEGTNTDDYINAIITNNEPVYDAIGQIRRVYPNTLKLEIKNNKILLSLEEQKNNLESIKQKSEMELFNEFYNLQNNDSLNEEQIKIMNNIIGKAKDLRAEGML